MLRGIPGWLGTTLIVFGVVVMPICYYAVSYSLRQEAACTGADLQCVADIAAWRQLAIAGFVTALGISAIGVILDRLRNRR